MYALIADGFSYLQSQSGLSLLLLFWYVFIFEIPRYTVNFAIALLFRRHSEDMAPDLLDNERISVIVAGHNEEDAIERCVLALHEQSRPPDEIIVVSDGSTDRMAEKIGTLLRRGLIDSAHATELRAGKSAAVNLADRSVTGEIMINIDCDCSFDRHAFRNIVKPFVDPDIGAVSGNILVRNPQKSLVTSFQAIEYLISVSMGKQAAAQLGQVTCASGAFSAFRQTALHGVGGMDAGGGEDLDVTLRLRQAGWKIDFAESAICYTDVPDTLTALTRQRFRWERDAVRLRYRKHIDLMNPFSPQFNWVELVHEVEFFIFHIVAAIALPIYLVWLFFTYGDLAPIVLVAAQAGLVVMDVFTFSLAAIATPKVRSRTLLPYLLGYSIFNGFLMRFIRIAAYMQEWVFKASYKDTYVPDKVHRVRG
tara:strand:+ start:94327 stop:95592 length:1266 start_codon:yes stop_codon:yes gene_type:complete